MWFKTNKQTNKQTNKLQGSWGIRPAEKDLMWHAGYHCVWPKSPFGGWLGQIRHVLQISPFKFLCKSSICFAPLQLSTSF